MHARSPVPYLLAIWLACACAMLGAPANAAAAEVGHWSFNDSYADTSPNSNTLVPDAAPDDPWFAAGRFGQSVGFSYTSGPSGGDEAQAPHIAAYNLDVFTVETWFNTTDVSSQGASNFASMISKSSGATNRNFALEFRNNVAAGCAAPPCARLSLSTDLTTSHNLQVPASSFVDGQWHHIAGVVDESKTMRLYIDGVERGSQSFTGNVDNPSTPIWFAQAGVAQFVGRLDEAVFHDRALSAADIRERYEAESAEYAGTLFDPSGCQSFTATTQIEALPGSSATTSEDCILRFGSADDQALLRIAQADHIGEALFQLPDGQTDTGFGSSGLVAQDMGAAAEAARTGAYDPVRDRTYVVGTVGSAGSKDLGILALDGAGAPDNGFSGDGERVDSLSGGDDGPGGAVVQPDGKLLVSGAAGSQAMVARYLPDGALDTSFSGDGVAIIGAGSGIDNLTLLDDGRILGAGYGYGASSDDFLAIRLNADGSFDRTFGTNGVVKADLGSNVGDYAAQALVLASGKIMLVGTTTSGGNNVAFLRLNADGTRDTTLNGRGQATYSLSAGNEWTEDAVLLGNGTIVTTGFSNNGTNDVITIAQFNQDGVIEAGFGNSGKRQIAVGASWSYSFGLIAGPDDHIYVAGEEAGGQLVVIALNSLGANEASFGNSGMYLGTQGNGAWGFELIEGPDGSLTAVGETQTGAVRDFAVHRLRAATITDYAPGANDWDQGADTFGACLRTGTSLTTGVTAGWTADSNATCTAVDSDPWNSIDEGDSRVAVTDQIGQTNASANIRFGVKIPPALAPGTAAAPLEFEVVAPNLYPPSNTALPTIDDTTPTTRQVLTANPGTWSGSATIRYAYQWSRSSGTCAAGTGTIAGATSSTYAVRSDDVNCKLTVTVTATNSEGSASATSSETTLQVANAALTGIQRLGGFEHGIATPTLDGAGLFDSWINGGDGTYTVTSAKARTGNYSLKNAPTSNTHELRWNVPPTGVGVARVAFLVEAYPTAEEYIFELETTSTQWGLVALDQNGRIGVDIDGGRKYSTQRIELGRWYVLDMRLDPTVNGNWTLDWQLDGVAQPQDTANLAPSTVRYATFVSDVDRDQVVYYDDVVVSTTSSDYPIGPGAVHGLTPMSAATHSAPINFDYSTNNGTGWTTVNGEANGTTPGTSQHIDDWPIVTGGSADMIRQWEDSGAGHLQYNLTDSPIPVDPNGVKVLGAFREAAAGPNNVLVHTRSAAGNEQTPINLQDPGGGATTPWYFAGVSADPDGDGWTDADIDGLKLKLEGNDANPDVWTDALLVEVDYPSTGLENTARPTISGELRVGKTLTATTGSWSATPTGYRYQWLSCNVSGSQCANVGTNSSTYTLAGGDVSKTIRVEVTAQSPYGGQSARSTYSRLVAPQIPTLTYLTGFEHGTISAAGGGVATALGTSAPTISTISHNGKYSMRVDKANGDASNRIRYALSASNAAVLRSWVRIDRLPTSGTNLGLMYADTAAGNDFQIQVNDQGRMFSQLGGNTAVSSTQIVPARWYLIEMQAWSNIPTRTLQWSIDGVQQTAVQSTEAASTIANAHFGAKWTTDNGLTYYDDIAVSQTVGDYPIGNGKVLGFGPDGTGTHNPTISNFRYSPLVNLTSVSWATLGAGDNAQTPGTAKHLDDWPANTETPTTLNNPFADGDVNDQCGTSTTTGDVNGDGRDDVIAGCERNDDGAADAGSALVFLRNEGNTGYLTAVELDNPFPEANDHCGHSVASGDLNGDGRDDVIMGCDLDNSPSNTGAGSAIVFLSQGGSPATFAAGVQVFHPAPSNSDNCGESVAAGDVDRDGLDDLILGCYFQVGGQNAAGGAVVFTSRGGSPISFNDGIEIENPNPLLQDRCGSAAAPGDVNGDGAIDVVLGCFDNDAGAVGAGSAVVFTSNADAPISFDTGVELTNPFPLLDDNCGGSAATGDVDNDGFDDVILGCQMNDDGAGNAGSALVFTSNGDAPITFDAGVEFDNPTPAAADFCGSDIASGDTNDDGRDDLVIGCYGTTGGSVIVATSSGGAPITFDAGLEIANPWPVGTDNCGYSAAVGDVTGSGRMVPVMGCRRDGTGDEGTVITVPTSDVLEQTAFDGDYAEYTLADTEGTVAPNAVRILGAVGEQVSAGGNNIQAIAVDGGSTQSMYSVDPGSGTEYYAGIMSTKPSGGAWTTAALNGLKLRVDSSNVGAATNRPRTNALLAEADFPAGEPPEMTKRPAISVPGDWPRVNMQLSVSNGSWTNGSHDFTYQWQACTAGTTTCMELYGSEKSYTLTNGELGKTIRAIVCAKGPGGTQCAIATPTPEVATDIPNEAFVTGFEHGAVSLNGGGLFNQLGGATVSADTAIKHSGTYALKTVSAGAQPWVSKNLTGGEVSVMRFSFYVDALPNGTTGIASWTTTNYASRPDPAIRLSATGQLQAAYYDGSWQAITTGPTLQTGTWYTIDARLDSRTANWRVDWRVNGVAQSPALYSTNTATETSLYTYLGLMQGGVTGTFHYDNWAVSLTYNDYPLKAGRVLALRPDGMGTDNVSGANQFRDHLAANLMNGWGLIDDNPFDPAVSGDYYTQSLSGWNNYIESTLSDSPLSSQVLGVRGVVEHLSASDSGPNDAATKIVRVGDTEAGPSFPAVVYQGDMSVTTKEYKGAMIAAPTGGWTTAHIDGLRLRTGYWTGLWSVPWWSGAVVEVDYADTS